MAYQNDFTLPTEIVEQITAKWDGFPARVDPRHDPHIPAGRAGKVLERGLG